jgi:hypothetical protein
MRNGCLVDVEKLQARGVAGQGTCGTAVNGWTHLSHFDQQWRAAIH